MRNTIHKKQKSNCNNHLVENDISKFQDPDSATNFESKINQKLSSKQVNEQYIEEWRTIHDIVAETVNTIISFTKTTN